jgi:hypothetical protein|tara:strand:+ start:814 stop:933 length:120 start_codon:yes stop_codon:yes gene_type:complete
MIRIILISFTLSSCATYQVEIGEPIWGANEQEIHPLEKK